MILCRTLAILGDWALNLIDSHAERRAAHAGLLHPDSPTTVPPPASPSVVGPDDPAGASAVQPAAPAGLDNDGWAYCIRYIQHAADEFADGGTQRERSIALVLRDIGDSLIDAARFEWERAEADARIARTVSEISERQRLWAERVIHPPQ